MAALMGARCAMVGKVNNVEAIVGKESSNPHFDYLCMIIDITKI